MIPRRAFTLVELLIVLAIIGVLVGLLAPAVQHARASARRAACASRLREIGLAMLRHCDDHNGEFPEWSHAGAGRSWVVSIAPYLESVDAVRICPDDVKAAERLAAGATSFVVSDYLAAEGAPGGVRNRNQLRETSKTIAVYEVADSLPADPAIDHAHASQWFSPLNLAWGLVSVKVHADTEPGRHAGAANYLYVDGRVALVSESQIEEWIQQPWNFAEPH